MNRYYEGKYPSWLIAIAAIFWIALFSVAFLVNQEEPKKQTLESASVKINATQTYGSVKDNRIFIDVTMINHGDTDIDVELNDESLSMYLVNVKGDKMGAKKVFHPKAYQQLAIIGTKETNKTRRYITLLPGATKQIEYVVTVEDPGMYYITFNAAHQGDDTRETNWFAGKYLDVMMSETWM